MNDVQLTGEGVLQLDTKKADKAETYNKTEVDNLLNNQVKTIKKELTITDVEHSIPSEIEEFSGFFIRNNNIVDFYGRIKVKTPLSTGKIIIFNNIPEGFRLSNDYTNSSWDVPISIGRNQEPKLFNATAFAERNTNDGNKMILYCDYSGNYYLHGHWYTDDFLPGN